METKEKIRDIKNEIEQIKGEMKAQGIAIYCLENKYKEMLTELKQSDDHSFKCKTKVEEARRELQRLDNDLEYAKKQCTENHINVKEFLKHIEDQKANNKVKFLRTTVLQKELEELTKSD